MSAIEWTDVTWNPVTGCDRVSPGCAHCYALTLAARLKGMGQPRYQRDGDPRTSGPGFGVTLHPDKLDEPLRWRRPRMVFVNSMSDLFHDHVPFVFIAQVFATMAAAPQHTFQVLTKRPERARAVLTSPAFQAAELVLSQRPWPLPNVWLGVSVENSRYTYRADVLRETPAAVRFISAEPLLGSLFQETPHRGAMRRDGDAEPRDAHRGSREEAHASRGVRGEAEVATAEDASPTRQPVDLTGIDWVIVGGESGPGARPMHPDWARELRDACMDERGWAFTLGYGDARGPLPGEPAFFFKQHGEWAPSAQMPGVYPGDICWSLGPTGTLYTVDQHYVCAPNESDGEWLRRVGKKRAGRLLDGREWNEMPARRLAAAG